MTRNLLAQKGHFAETRHFAETLLKQFCLETAPIVSKWMENCLLLYEKFIKFGKDRTLMQNQTYYYCKADKGVYAIMLGNKWNKKGMWNIFYENLEITIGNKTIDLMTKRVLSDNVKFVVASISRH